jgi:hydrogenase maturation protease
MSDERFDVTVLGIGNLLWADEGFGVRCVERFHRRYEPAEGVRVLDGGTQGLYLVDVVTSTERLLVFDAVDYGLAPGTLRRVAGDDVPRFMGAKKMSLHQTGFQDVLAAADLLGGYPPQVVLIGVQPSELDDWGGGLTDVVAARLDEAVDLGAAELERWGYAPAPRPRLLAASDSLCGALERDRYEAGRPPSSEVLRQGDGRFLGFVPGADGRDG